MDKITKLCYPKMEYNERTYKHKDHTLQNYRVETDQQNTELKIRYIS